MNKYDFVTYEDAVKLEELGFDEACLTYYAYRYPTGVAISNKEIYAKDCNDDEVLCPSLAQATKWLRKVESIHVFADINCVGEWFASAIDLQHDYKDLINDGEMYDTYEAALSAGIDFILTILLKGKRHGTKN